ncbi:MAG: hypothetical protein V3S11_05385 [Elusimicrobiota bacterium]
MGGLTFGRFWRHPRWTKAHRWITLLIGLQIIAWTAGGIVFVWSDLDNIHGDFEVRAKKPEPVDLRFVGSPGRLAVANQSKKLGRRVVPRRIILREHFGRTAFVVYEKGSIPAGMVDAGSGVVLTPLVERAARRLARSDFKGGDSIKSVVLLKEAPTEYRGGELPIWRVEFDNPKQTRLYLSPQSGRIRARRNWNWRLFDFFWMLHTMDYRGRDDFNHWLIRGASVLAGLTALSGLLLLLQRLLPVRGGRKKGTLR